MSRRTTPRPQGIAQKATSAVEIFASKLLRNSWAAGGIPQTCARPSTFPHQLAGDRTDSGPEEIEDLAAVIATGRSDYPNQINNVLVFPGVFRGALDVRASAITKEMELAAAHALAGVIPSDQLSADYIIPSVFDRSVAPLVARAVAEVAGVARVGVDAGEDVRELLTARARPRRRSRSTSPPRTR
jgi:malate dehydrogenase (oxaloacetate-decarboxylating)